MPDERRAVPLPEPDEFPEVGEVGRYGRDWMARGVAPGAAVLSRLETDEQARGLLVRLAATVGPVLRSVAPHEFREGRVRFVPGIAVLDGNAVVPASGMVTPTRTGDGIRGAIWVTPNYEPADELGYHEAVHLHLFEGRIDPGLLRLFSGDDLDELDRQHQGIAEYDDADKPEERLAFWTGRLCRGRPHGRGAEATLPGGVVHTLSGLVSRVRGGTVAAVAGEGVAHRLPRHRSLRHPDYQRFLSDLRSGAIGRRPPDPRRREEALRQRGFTGHGDPALDSLPRYSAGRLQVGILTDRPRQGGAAAVASSSLGDASGRREWRAGGSPTAVAMQRSDTEPAPTRPMSLMEVDMNAIAGGAAPQEPPVAIPGWIPSQPLPLADPRVRTALRPILDGWWFRHAVAVSEADPLVDSPDALLTDPANTANGTLSALRADLLGELARAAGATAIVVGGETWRAPEVPPDIPTVSPDGETAATGDLRPHRAGLMGGVMRSARDGPLAATAVGMAVGATAVAAAGSMIMARPAAPQVVELSSALGRGLPPSIAELERVLMAPELVDAGLQLARELGTVSRKLQQLNLPPEVAGTMARLATQGGEAAAVGAERMGWTENGFAIGGDYVPLPDAGAVERALSQLPVEAAAPAREVLAAYADALTYAYSALGGAVPDPLLADIAITRLAEIQGFGINATLPVMATRAAEAAKLAPAVQHGPDTLGAMADHLAHSDGFGQDPQASALAATQDDAIVDGMRAMLEHGLDPADLPELAVNDVLPSLLDRFPSESDAIAHLSRLAHDAITLRASDLEPTARLPAAGMLDGLGHQVAQAATDIIVQGVQLLEPLGYAAARAAQVVDAVVQAGQGVVYSARETGPAVAGTPDKGSIRAPEPPATVVRLDDRRPAGTDVLDAEDRAIRHQAAALAAAVARIDRRDAAQRLELELASAGVPHGIVDALLLPLGRLPSDGIPAARPGEEPARLEAARHALELAERDLPVDAGAPQAASRAALQRRQAEYADAVSRGDRQQARRDLKLVARRAGIADAAIQGLRPTAPGFLDRGNPLLARAVAEAVTDGTPEAMRLAARNAGLQGPFWVVADRQAREHLAGELDRIKRHPVLGPVASAAQPATHAEAARALLLHGTPSGAPPGVLPPAETCMALLGVASAATSGLAPSLSRAVASLCGAEGPRTPIDPAQVPSSTSSLPPGVDGRVSSGQSRGRSPGGLQR